MRRRRRDVLTLAKSESALLEREGSVQEVPRVPGSAVKEDKKNRSRSSQTGFLLLFHVALLHISEAMHDPSATVSSFQPPSCFFVFFLCMKHKRIRTQRHNLFG